MSERQDSCNKFEKRIPEINKNDLNFSKKTIKNILTRKNKHFLFNFLIF
jgi:hypothetical protein